MKMLGNSSQYSKSWALNFSILDNVFLGLSFFVKTIEKVPEIIECHHVTGSCDFLLKVIARDIASYQNLIMDTINEIEVVASTQTMVILSTFKNTKVLPIP